MSGNDSSAAGYSWRRRNRLGRLRTTRGLSLEALERLCGVSAERLAAYEAGTRRPDAYEVLALADALECTTDELLGHVPAAARKGKKS
jgi:transcriptional regulator with XRE-family HTH domain